MSGLEPKPIMNEGHMKENRDSTHTGRWIRPCTSRLYLENVYKNYVWGIRVYVIRKGKSKTERFKYPAVMLHQILAQTHSDA